MQQTDDIEPIVPELPRTRNPIPDGGTQSERTIEPPNQPDCTPEDKAREAIDPLVPDLR